MRTRPPRRTTRRVPVVPALALVAALPALFAAAAVAGSDWYPSTDQALEVMRMRDVGGPHTPLVGVWSRWGYSHPGPWMLWVLAPFARLLGPTGVLVGTGLLNSAAAAGAVLVAGRPGGLASSARGARRDALAPPAPPSPTTDAALVALATLALSGSVGMSLGLSGITDPWNPYVAVLPFWTFLLAMSAAARGDRWMWPVAVLLGSFAAQAHIAYLPLVGGVGLVALGIVGATALGRRRRRDAATASGRPGHRRAPATPATDGQRRPGDGDGWRLPLAATGIVATVLWLPAVVQQLFGSPGNLSEILDFAGNPGEDTWGWRLAFEVAGRQLGHHVPWIIGRNSAAPSGLVAGGPVVVGSLAVAALAALAALARARGHRGAVPGATLAIAACAIATVTTSRMTGFAFSYLVLWWRPVAALVAVTLAATALRFAPASLDAAIGRVAAVLTVPVAGVVMAVGWPVEPPEPEVSEALAELVPGVGRALDEAGTYQVDSVEDTFAAAGPGLVAWLDGQGIDARVRPSELAVIQFGEQRVVDGGELDGRVLVVSQSFVDLGWTPPEGAVEVASYDSLTAAERDELQELLAELRASVDGAGAEPPAPAPNRESLTAAGADPALVERYLDQLPQRTAYRVYVVPADAGTGGN